MKFDFCDQLVSDFLKKVENPVIKKGASLYAGVDLGTACVVICVVDETGAPVAGTYQYADVVKDGMLVDYLGASQIVKDMKQLLEKQLGTKLKLAAAAKPPGTEQLDAGAIRHVVENAEFEIDHILDEPTAANEVLRIENGAIVDIGGGTTGISIITDGKATYVSDEPTGGTHFTLVIAGAKKIPYDEAEVYKRDYKNHKELLVILTPVIEKVASIITRHIENKDVKELVLVGGASCLNGIEDIIADRTGIFTHKPQNPMFVTPLGIALSCLKAHGPSSTLKVI